MSPTRRALLVWALFLPGAFADSGPSPLSAQEADAGVLQDPGESLQVYLMTIGQGSSVWERFGHNAIWIRDRVTGWEAAYNWGVFDFDQVDFIPRLAKGTMLYKMAPYDPPRALEEYGSYDRPVWIQELALTPAQKADLLEFVLWNALPENQEYRYDYYRDNCSTRVRDALDQVLDGRIREAFQTDTTAATYRWHTRRLLRDRGAAYLGIQFVLGPNSDQPITGWEEMFLPLRLMERIRDVRIPDGEGGTIPLVSGERVLLETSRPPPPQGPPFALPWFLGVGLLWGGSILWLSRDGRKRGWGRRLGLTVLAGSWTLVAALSGSLLLSAWLFTDHFFWYRNLNLLQVNPLFFPLLLAFALFLFRDGYPRWGKYLAKGLALLSILGGVVWIIPGLGQGNGEILAFFLPMNVCLWLASDRLYEGRDHRSSAAPGSSR